MPGWDEGRGTMGTWVAMYDVNAGAFRYLVCLITRPLVRLILLDYTPTV